MPFSDYNEFVSSNKTKYALFTNNNLLLQLHALHKNAAASFVSSVRHLPEVRAAAVPLPSIARTSQTYRETDGQSETAERACRVQLTGDALSTCRCRRQLFSSTGRFPLPEGAQQSAELWEERKEGRKEGGRGGRERREEGGKEEGDEERVVSSVCRLLLLAVLWKNRGRVGV